MTTTEVLEEKTTTPGGTDVLLRTVLADNRELVCLYVMTSYGVPVQIGGAHRHDAFMAEHTHTDWSIASSMPLRSGSTVTSYGVRVPVVHTTTDMDALVWLFYLADMWAGKFNPESE